MLSLDNIWLHIGVAKNLSRGYNQVYWVLQIVILEKNHRFLVFLRKMKEKKLRRSYQMNMNHYLYPKYYDPSIDTFLFNRLICGQ